MTKATRPGHLPPSQGTGRGGRVCTHEGCQTRLSVYNTSDRCWQHTEIEFPNRRGRRLRDRPS
ncbi:MAG TPA: hypothetical protein VLA90_02440 [Actinomycetota bacterium]|nr:hypothetical protein [Actinomycetota bacterium]